MFERYPYLHFWMVSFSCLLRIFLQFWPVPFNPLYRWNDSQLWYFGGLLSYGVPVRGNNVKIHFDTVKCFKFYDPIYLFALFLSSGKLLNKRTPSVKSSFSRHRPPTFCGGKSLFFTLSFFYLYSTIWKLIAILHYVPRPFATYNKSNCNIFENIC